MKNPITSIRNGLQVISLRIRTALGVEKSFLFFYEIVVGVRLLDVSLTVTRACGDIAFRATVLPSKEITVKLIKKTWEAKGYEVKGVFITSVQPLSSLEGAMWVKGTDSDGIPSPGEIAAFAATHAFVSTKQ